jgi:RNA polymerase sigma-70 factor (ECF subfamily)
MKLKEHPYRFARVGAAAEETVLAVQERLYPFVSSAVRDPHAAEDILQDVVLIVLEQVHLLRRPDRLWPWIYRVAWSKVQDHFRSHQRFRRAVAPIRLECGRCDAADDLLDTMVRRETVEQLTIALDRLTHRCRIVLYLRFYEQMPYTEIASLMHSTPGQIRVQYHRAKKLLRDSLLASCA